MLYVRSELNLGLDASELAGLVERHGVRAVEDVVSGLGTARRRKKFVGHFHLVNPVCATGLLIRK